MDVPTQEQLIESIDAFLARHPKIGEARFGRDATGEPGLVPALRAGRSPTMRIVAKIADYMREADAVADHADANTVVDASQSPGKTGEISASQVPA